LGWHCRNKRWNHWNSESRRQIGRIATLLSAAAALPFYNEYAMAQDAEQSLVSGLPGVSRANRKLAAIELGGAEESGLYQLKAAVPLQEEMGAQLPGLAV